MDDTCAVCADVLEWVAYGACGHREVCSTCVARLRFICEDRRCCICKAESDVVFISKALGDYTRMISDFKVLPPDPREGRVGSYWYHEDTQAFFDDVDQYRMIKAMCRLACSECDKMEEESNDGPKRRPQKFRNIEQLKGHLFHRHKLFMCSLCLEGRKVFICEQKLYTRAQLKQHTSTGDSEVDGNESERGGFTGHPMCEFCKTPFYGDNELYSHMTTEHYTCHICQRQHQGQYEYYKNYDDLEMHFRQDHFLCEDESCLAKKFVVFPSESEMKRHNTMEHGGRMSRAQRNAALQIPTSFRYRRNEQDRRGRGRTFHRDRSDNQLSIAIQASLETANSENSSHDPSPSIAAPSSSAPADVDDFDPVIPAFEALTATDSEASSRYLQALGQGSRNASLQESSFPPLFVAPSSSSQPRSKPESESLLNNSMAAHLRRQNKRSSTVTSSAQGWPASGTSSAQGWPAASRARGPSGSMQHRPVISAPPALSSSARPAPPGFASSSQVQAQSATVHGRFPTGSSGNLVNTSRIRQSSSAPNLTEGGQLKSSSSDIPPVSAIQVPSVATGSLVLPNVEDVQTANRSLVEKIRDALEYDEDKYSLFKDVSGQYRQGAIDTGKYLDYVKQYGLSHLILELARLCPDAQKQKEMVETYNASLRSKRQENGWDNGSANLKDSKDFTKGKGKKVVETNSSRDRLADSIMDTVRTLHTNYKPVEQDVEVLSKDGYRPARGKSTVVMTDEQQEVGNGSGNGLNQNATGGSSASKQRKKTSKFQRVRLGDGSMAALFDLKNSDPDPDPDGGNGPTAEGLPVVRGAWRKGGHKLFPGQ